MLKLTKYYHAICNIARPYSIFFWDYQHL